MTIEDLLRDLVRDEVRSVLTEALDELVERPVAVSKAEAAKALGGVSTAQVESWLDAGLLARLPHTARVLVTRASIEAFAATAMPPAGETAHRRAS